MHKKYVISKQFLIDFWMLLKVVFTLFLCCCVYTYYYHPRNAKRDHGNSHINALLMSPPPPSSLELLLLERAKALQQHHHHQQQQQHHSANNITSPSLKPFPHFPSQGFGSLRPGLFPPASQITTSNSSGLGGGFHSGPEELLQRWRQQLPHMPANIQEDSRMDITVAPPPAPVTPTQSSPREKTATAAADSLAAAFSRPDPSPSPTGSLTHREQQAVSPPTGSHVDDLPPAVAVLNGGNIGDRQQLHAEGENDEENLAAVEKETKEQTAVTAATALTDIDRESPGRCQENSSPVKSEDSNLGELMTPQLPALSPLSPYSSALGLGLPSLLSSASR